MHDAAPFHDAFALAIIELDLLIDRHFAAKRTLLVEPEGTNWTASLSDAVLYRSPDRSAVIRFAWAFQAKTPGIDVEIVHTVPGEHSVRVPRLAVVQ